MEYTNGTSPNQLGSGYLYFVHVVETNEWYTAGDSVEAFQIANYCNGIVYDKLGYILPLLLAE